MEHAGSLESTKEAQELPEAIAEGNSSFLITGGIMHQIRREKRTTISETIVRVNEILSKISVVFPFFASSKRKGRKIVFVLGLVGQVSVCIQYCREI